MTPAWIVLYALLASSWCLVPLLLRDPYALTREVAAPAIAFDIPDLTFDPRGFA